MDYFSGYIGTYTQGVIGRGKGIYAFTLSAENGVLEDLCLVAESDNPSYLALSASKKYLYAVNEIDGFNGKASGAVSAFAVSEKNGDLTFLNQKSSGGKSPCHIALNGKSSHAIVSNYMSGNIGVFPIKIDGFLEESCQIIQFHGSGPNKERQERSHAHFFMFDKDYSRGFACDLGADRVNIYSFDEKTSTPLKEISSFASDSGAGPRHALFHPDGKGIYVLNELTSSIDVIYEKKRQTVRTLPEGYSLNNTTAAIKISPCGRFLYASNRGHDSIAVFKVLEDGSLRFLDAIPSGGNTPRDFAVDPSGNFLLVCHQDSDNLVIFNIDKDTGFFRKAYEYAIPSGVCIIFT